MRDAFGPGSDAELCEDAGTWMSGPAAESASGIGHADEAEAPDLEACPIEGNPLKAAKKTCQKGRSNFALNLLAAPRGSALILRRIVLPCQSPRVATA